MTHKTQKGRRRWQRSCFLITWNRKNWENFRKRKSWHKLWKHTFYVEARKKEFVQCIIKQLLDWVFVISRIIKVSVRVISLSRAPTSTLISDVVYFRKFASCPSSLSLYYNLTQLWLGIFEDLEKWVVATGNKMTSRASLKLFLRNVLFFDNISVLKVYSKSFVYNAFNDFARYSPHPSFICSVKRDTRTQGHCQTFHQWRPVSRRDRKNRYNCVMYSYISQTVFTLWLIPTIIIIIISYPIFQLIMGM